jgi:ABC-type dipeptide/oligopeptide/nickel transport system permease component
LSAARRSAAPAPALILSALLAGTGAVLTAENAWTVALRIAVELPATAGLAATALGAGAWIGARAGARLGVGRAAGRTGWLLAGAGPALPGFLLAAVFAVLIGRTDGEEGSSALAWMAAWAALMLPAAAQAAHLARTTLTEAVNGPLAFGALARGLPMETVLHGQARPAALGAVAQALASAGPAMVTGTVAAEALFGLPGVGHLFVMGARNGETGPACLVLAGLVLLALLLNKAGTALPGWISTGTATGTEVP